MKMAVERINEIKRAIGIGAKAVAFAGAIYLAIYTGIRRRQPGKCGSTRTYMTV